MNQLSLFDVQNEYSPAPVTALLADRMRPETLEDYMGQDHREPHQIRLRELQRRHQRHQGYHEAGLIAH